jgi:hypothetical protein
LTNDQPRFVSAMQVRGCVRSKTVYSMRHRCLRSGPRGEAQIRAPDANQGGRPDSDLFRCLCSMKSEAGVVPLRDNVVQYVGVHHVSTDSHTRKSFTIESKVVPRGLRGIPWARNPVRCQTEPLPERGKKTTASPSICSNFSFRGFGSNLLFG